MYVFECLFVLFVLFIVWMCTYVRVCVYVFPSMGGQFPHTQVCFFWKSKTFFFALYWIFYLFGPNLMYLFYYKSHPQPYIKPVIFIFHLLSVEGNRRWGQIVLLISAHPVPSALNFNIQPQGLGNQVVPHQNWSEYLC